MLKMNGNADNLVSREIHMPSGSKTRKAKTMAKLKTPLDAGYMIVS